MIPKGSQDLQIPGLIQAAISDKIQSTTGLRDVDPSVFQMAVGHFGAKHNPLPQTDPEMQKGPAFAGPSVIYN